ncbi:sigma-70 family RNA polymerase sigma factor [Pseudomonas sp. CAM1A]|uniref:sigma-70 family RNA polymerase sigma factor n=1 Tax=Pseudomonas sp. CAM1A TaxID=3231717 RepID=UPI0039C63035
MQIEDTLKPAQVDLLYQAHHHWLRSWLGARVGCRENAADLAQDTFVRLLKARQASPLKEPRAYLSSIARGLMIDQFRRRALEKAYLESLASLPEQHAPSEEQRLVILDTLERLDLALQRLKPRARQAFLLAQLDGLSLAQIAQRLDVSRATVERDLAKALGACYRMRYADT